MTTYEPGTVAVATVQGVEGVRVMRPDLPGDPIWFSVPSIDGRVHRADEVTNVRPLAVLDLNEQSVRRVVEVLRGKHLDLIADQIESQTKPLRIPEPGLWGVVEASPSKGSPTPRRWVRYGTGWRDAFANHLEWDDLIDPTLIREGVEPDA